jgi:hypothetical protein
VANVGYERSLNTDASGPIDHIAFIVRMSEQPRAFQRDELSAILLTM